jgi:hypothetical protein
MLSSLLPLSLSPVFRYRRKRQNNASLNNNKTQNNNNKTTNISIHSGQHMHALSLIASFPFVFGTVRVLHNFAIFVNVF